ncbi:MAG: hypothetical protein WD040_05620 [Anaerolineales bacterium]
MSRRFPLKFSKESEPAKRPPGQRRSLFGLAVALLVGGIVLLAVLILLGGVLFRPDTTVLPTPVPTIGVPVLATQIPPSEQWVVTFEYRYPRSTLTSGQHQYTLEANCPDLPSLSGRWTLLFEVSGNAPLLQSLAYLRTRGVSQQTLGGTFLSQVNPAQPLAAAYSLIFATQSEANQARLACTVAVTLDSGVPNSLSPNVPDQQ